MHAAARIAAPSIALALTVTGVTPAATREVLPPATEAGDIQVFNVSLKLVKCTNHESCTGEWMDYFDRLHVKAHKPDLLHVLEIPFGKKDKVVSQLASAMNTPLEAWKTVHSDKGVTCSDLMDCGNSMIVYRAPKFVKLGTSRFHRHEMVDVDGDGDKECKKDVVPVKRRRDVAVKLQETDSGGNPIPGRVVVGAAVHLPPSLNMTCVKTSSQWIREQVALMEGDLSVVTGDYNRTPSGTGVGNDETLAQRKETCPAPWYKAWSLPQSTPDTTCSTGFGGEYRDAIRMTHSVEPSDICTEWTAWNQSAENDPGKCKEGGKRRIDFVWLRRVVGGVAAEPAVVSAGTDRGYHQDPDNWSGRYSDHRALEALVRL